VSRVYVAVRGTGRQVLAYYASAAGTFLRGQLPLGVQVGLPGYPLPTAHLGRLAVDLSCRGQRLGESLLFHFLRTACEVADRIGVFAVDLFSKDEEAKRFYLKYEFLPLQDDPFHLYLPLATVRTMFVQTAARPPNAVSQEGDAGSRPPSSP